MLFCRYGLEDVVRKRGALYSIFGIHEATNFESSLDNVPRDIDREPLGILQSPCQLTFLQLYATSPHAHLQMPFKYPVRNAIVT